MFKAKLNYLRISARKVRLAADLVRGLKASEAEKQLTFLPKRASRPLLKLINSAVANAQQKQADLTKDDLRITEIKVDSGPTLKRWRARAMGRAAPINKRTSHLTVCLESEKKPGKKTAQPVSQPEETEKQAWPETGQAPPAKKPSVKPKKTPPARPYPTSSQSKKRFFSRQTFGNAKKYFRRKDT